MLKKSHHHAEPRWPAALALISVGALYWSLPREHLLGPNWLPLAFAETCVIVLALTRISGHAEVNNVLSLVSLGVVTSYLAASLAMVVYGIPKHSETAANMLRSGGLLWFSNILVFSLWYWRLDAGGPHARENREYHTCGAFLFPQMTDEVIRMNHEHHKRWSPNFVDYLFVAFGISAAFSVTDTLPLSRWAKLLIMLQAGISIAIVALIVGRSVNIF